MDVFAIDPGTFQSAFVVWNGQCIKGAGIIPNEDLLLKLRTLHTLNLIDPFVVCEQMDATGQRIGEETIQTICWYGRFWGAVDENRPRIGFSLIRRSDVGLHLCFATHPGDTAIGIVLRDRFGPKPTKKKPNKVYGEFRLKRDEWQAFALAVTFMDNRRKLRHGERKLWDD
jgi:hypothetical protein